MQLKKIYQFYISGIESFYERQHYFKMLLAEKYALKRKSKLIKSVSWSKEQEKEFNTFWRQEYKPITSKGHKLIEAFNGTFNVEYMPDFLFATKVEYKMNPYLYAKIYSDKSLTEVLYKDKSNAIIPKTFLLNAGGVFYDENRRIITKEEARSILLNINAAAVKPTVGGNSGKGIVIGTFDEDGYSDEHKFSLLSLLEGAENFIVQELIQQSAALNGLYRHSINTFRVITYIVKGKVHVAPVSLRIGVGGSKVDNIHSGGLGIGVDVKNSSLLKTAYQLGYSDQCKVYEMHPDSQISFSDYSIPGIQEIVESAQKLHEATPQMGIISWDLTLNSNNKPVLIEANYIGQAVWLSQIVNQTPIFGKHTAYILNQIK
ncbi:MAG: hypothetical protein MK211_11305 [Flavobacteriales bacterium]|jgi:hypothetical protein|nr:hypothetical protein [Flavobacteriales bacterium]